LERIEAGGSGDAAQALRVLRPLARRRGVVVLVSEFLPPRESATTGAAEPRAFAAHGHDVMLLQVRDPEEAELSLPGAWRFVDPESGARRDAHAPSVAAHYRERASAFARSVREEARAARIDLALAPTDRSPVEPLAALVATRRRA